MKLKILFPGRVLHARGYRDMSGLDRSLAQDRKLLEYEFKVGIRLQEFEHVGHGVPAITAIVVEELNHRDIALRVSEHDLMWRAENCRAVVIDRESMFFGFSRLLTLVQLSHHVLHHLGMADQVILDDALDLLALIGGERLCLDGRGNG